MFQREALRLSERQDEHEQVPGRAAGTAQVGWTAPSRSCHAAPARLRVHLRNHEILRLSSGKWRPHQRLCQAEWQPFQGERWLHYFIGQLLFPIPRSLLLFSRILCQSCMFSMQCSIIGICLASFGMHSRADTGIYTESQNSTLINNEGYQYNHKTAGWTTTKVICIITIQQVDQQRRLSV